MLKRPNIFITINTSMQSIHNTENQFLYINDDNVPIPKIIKRDINTTNPTTKCHGMWACDIKLHGYMMHKLSLNSCLKTDLDINTSHFRDEMGLFKAIMAFKPCFANYLRED